MKILWFLTLFSHVIPCMYAKKRRASSTNVYDGNFIKTMLRITNLMMNFKDICNYLKKYELLQVIENYEEKIIRDVVSIQSLYVEGL